MEHTNWITRKEIERYEGDTKRRADVQWGPRLALQHLNLLQQEAIPRTKAWLIELERIEADLGHHLRALEGRGQHGRRDVLLEGLRLVRHGDTRKDGIPNVDLLLELLPTRTSIDTTEKYLNVFQQRRKELKAYLKEEAVS